MPLAAEDCLVHVKPMQRVGQYLPHVVGDGDGPSEPNFTTEFSEQLGFIWNSCSFGVGTKLHYLAGISLWKP